MAWLPLSQPQYVLQCSQPESFGNVFISKSELPSKNRQSSCTCCLSIGTQNRCEPTIWVGMQNLCYCKSWHYEHHLLMTFRYGLMWRIQSHRLQTRHFRKATLFSSLRLFLPCGTLSGKAKQGHQPSHCSTAHYCSLRQHLSINTLPNTSSLSAYLWLSAIQQQGTFPSLMLCCNKSSSAPKHTFDFKACVICWWHTYVRLGIHVSVRANSGALHRASSPPGAGTAWICMQEGEHVLCKSIYRRWAHAGT